MTMPKNTEVSITFDPGYLAHIAVAEAMKMPALQAIEDIEQLRVHLVYKGDKLSGLQITAKAPLHPTTPSIRL